jgi:hypothetical protein
MVEVTIAITTPHTEFDPIIDTFDKALRGALVKVVPEFK